jgi:cysteine desulfurase / selenocysteine lyase
VLQVQTETLTFDPRTILEDFPILKREIHGHPLVYLDSAASAQRPRHVIDREREVGRTLHANVHRSAHTLANETTAAFERTRDRVAKWINASRREEIVFTRGTTEALNIVARCWAEKNMRKGERIVLTRMEHHANLVPWIRLAKSHGFELSYIDYDSEYRLDLKSIEKSLTPNTRLVAVAHASNVLGTVNPIREITKAAHKIGAVVVVDGAQAAPHLPIDMQDLDADFYAFSAHKMLGPTGVGILYGKYDLLSDMDPWMTGGEMINRVSYFDVSYAGLPHKFEAGTPHIAGVIAFNEAIEYLDTLGMENVAAHEMAFSEYALQRLGELPFVTMYGPPTAEDRTAVFSFNVHGVLPDDIAQLLDADGVAVRTGHHCAQPLVEAFGCSSTVRASGYIYNSNDDVDTLVESLKRAYSLFA